MQKEKKGELTTQQIVLLIILVTSFVIILLLLFRLNLNEQTQDQICHNSVILKGKSTLGSGNLDCKTSYVCVSGGEDCKDITPTRTIPVDPQNADDVYKEIADEMANCWWMFGEGKVDYVGLNAESATIGNVNCALCSVIKFDESVKNNVGEKTIGNLYDYLASTKKDNSQTYLYYLNKKNTYDDKNPAYSEKIDFSEKYVIVTGIAKAGALKSFDYWLGSGIDFLNSFVPFVEFDKRDKSSNYGPLPAVIVKQSEINKLGCEQYVTKA